MPASFSLNIEEDCQQKDSQQDTLIVSTSCQLNYCQGVPCIEQGAQQAATRGKSSQGVVALLLLCRRRILQTANAYTPVTATSVRLNSTRWVQSYGEGVLEVHAPGNSRCEGTNVHGHAVTNGELLRWRPG